MLGKPFIATTYIPGQESPNLAFIQRHGLGWVALTAAQRHTLLARLVRTGEALDAMSASVNAYRQWNLQATASIAPALRALLESHPASRASTEGG